MRGGAGRWRRGLNTEGRGVVFMTEGGAITQGVHDDQCALLSTLHCTVSTLHCTVSTLHSTHLQAEGHAHARLVEQVLMPRTQHSPHAVPAYMLLFENEKMHPATHIHPQARVVSDHHHIRQRSHPTFT